MHRGRGRPRRSAYVPEAHARMDTVNTAEQPVHRGRGRPRKSTSVPEASADSGTENTPEQPTQQGRRRRNKNTNSVTEASEGSCNLTSFENQVAVRRDQRLLRKHGHHKRSTDKSSPIAVFAVVVAKEIKV